MCGRAPASPGAVLMLLVLWRMRSTTAPGLWYKMQESFGYLTFGGPGYTATNGGAYHFPIAIGETGSFYTAVGTCRQPSAWHHGCVAFLAKL